MAIATLFRQISKSKYYKLTIFSEVRNFSPFSTPPPCPKPFRRPFQGKPPSHSTEMLLKIASLFLSLSFR